MNRYLALVFLRMMIGWHFLYEGWVKWSDPSWTSAGYLSGSTGPLAGLFQALAKQLKAVPVVDALNTYGLLAIGLALMLGVFVRAAAWSGIGLLTLYYLAYPPFFTPFANLGMTEGAYLIVNKTLVESFALIAILSIPDSHAGLQSWWMQRNRSMPQGAVFPQRRELVASLAGAPVLGAFVLALVRKHGWRSFEESSLKAAPATGKPDTFTASATVRRFEFASRSGLRGEIPMAAIRDLRVSRVIMGGNLIGGWAHARDLVYVSKLVRAYHHRDKIFQTLALAESCGINSLITNPALCGVIRDYWRQGGRIQFLSDCGNKDLTGAIRKSIDSGASACYIQGALADDMAAAGRFEEMAAALDLIRRNGLPAGIGAHKLSTVQGAVANGLHPDFWMKTLHQVNYWSARPGEKECDNIWCGDPDAVVSYMRGLPEPWIAFKVLAAGALPPKQSFQYAFESGADFICVGMYDFQIVEDVNLALDVLRGPLVRERKWMA